MEQKIKKVYLEKKQEIDSRLTSFKKIWSDKDDHRIFCELVFCIFTPQSKAKLCWETVEKLDKKGLLYNGGAKKIAKELNKVRFRNNKARYAVLVRKQFRNNGSISVFDRLNEFRDVYSLREWLVENIKGLGYKESSHFLRNIGLGDDLAILDRHILKNLKLLKVINEVPKTITKKRYLKIENMMKNFASG